MIPQDHLTYDTATCAWFVPCSFSNGSSMKDCSWDLDKLCFGRFGLDQLFVITPDQWRISPPFHLLNLCIVPLPANRIPVGCVFACWEYRYSTVSCGGQTAGAGSVTMIHTPLHMGAFCSIVVSETKTVGTTLPFGPFQVRQHLDLFTAPVL